MTENTLTIETKLVESLNPEFANDKEITTGNIESPNLIKPNKCLESVMPQGLIKLVKTSPIYFNKPKKV